MFQPLQPTLPVFSSSSAKLLCSYDALRDTNSFKTNNIIMLCWLVMSYYLLTWPSSVLIFLGKKCRERIFFSCNLSSYDVQKGRLQVSHDHRTRQEILGERRLRQLPFQSTFMTKLSKIMCLPQQSLVYVLLELVDTSINIMGQARGKSDFSLG